MSTLTQHGRLVGVPLDLGEQFEVHEYSSETDEQSKQNLLVLQAQRIAMLQEQISNMQAQVEALKQQILDTHDAGTFEAGDVKVIVSDGAKRLNVKKFEQAYPASAHPDLYKVSVDSSAVKNALSPNELAEFQTLGKRSVTVR